MGESRGAQSWAQAIVAVWMLCVPQAWRYFGIGLQSWADPEQPDVGRQAAAAATTLVSVAAAGAKLIAP